MVLAEEFNIWLNSKKKSFIKHWDKGESSFTLPLFAEFSFKNYGVHIKTHLGDETWVYAQGAEEIFSIASSFIIKRFDAFSDFQKLSFLISYAGEGIIIHFYEGQPQIDFNLDKNCKPNILHIYIPNLQGLLELSNIGELIELLSVFSKDCIDSLFSSHNSVKLLDYEYKIIDSNVLDTHDAVKINLNSAEVKINSYIRYKGEKPNIYTSTMIIAGRPVQPPKFVPDFEQIQLCLLNNKPIHSDLSATINKILRVLEG